jgi:tetratricopeptide (TPR) repeat protein
VLAAIGTAYADADDFERAIDYLRKALESEDTEREVSLRVVEQLANLEARWGADSGQSELVERAIERLRTLITLAETGERLSLLGSAYKRMAQMTEGKDREAALLESAAWYRRAVDRKLAGGELDPYPVLNWLTVDALLGKPPGDAHAWLARARAAAKERFAESRSVWDAAIIPDAALLEQFLADSFDSAASNELVAQYQAAFQETKATAKERDSVLKQLDFICAMATPPAGGKRRETLDAVRRIRGQLKESYGPSEAVSEGGAIQAPTPEKTRARTKPPGPKSTSTTAAKSKMSSKRKRPGLS